MNYDIVRELASVVNSILAASSSMMKYIQNTNFNDTIAPLIWDTNNNSSSRRKYISWHDSDINYYILSQLIYTASIGFVCLTELSQGPCIENQKSVLLAVTKCPALFEFLGE